MNQNLIKTFQQRGYFNQCTDLDNLTKLLDNKKIKLLSKLLNVNVESIDKYKLAGDFIESQAFAYLAIRSLEEKHLSLPTTTGVSKPVTGGIVYSN